MTKVSGKPIVGSKSPGIGYIYILLFMTLAIITGTALSGGPIPVDPNGPGGPPTLPPYYGVDGTGESQKIIPQGESVSAASNGLQLGTFQVRSCAKIVYYFLIDTSGSMADGRKINKMKQAINKFTKKISPKSGIAIQAFSSEVRSRVALSYYEDAKDTVDAGMKGTLVGGWTRTRDGFAAAKSEISQAITEDKFPRYKYNLILLTDGVPEIPASQQPRTCLAEADDPGLTGKRCFTKEQDPRVPTNIAQEIKNMGVDIYSVAIVSPQSQSDKALRPHLEKLMKDVATSPKHFYGSAGGNNLEKILDKIKDSACEVLGNENNVTSVHTVVATPTP